jgi:circadian clock protein KaiB
VDNTPDSEASLKKHKFILFVSGMSVNSARAIENLRKICETYIPDDFEVEIIDITREKEQAVIYQIIGVPTLIRTKPDPRRIILGDLSDMPKVLKVLDING